MGFVDNTNIGIDITEAVTDSFSGGTSFNETPSVEKLLIKNPFYEQRTPLEDHLPKHADRFSSLQAFEKVPCYLPEPHPEGDEPTYTLSEIACTTLDSLVDRFSYTNVVLGATTEDG